MNESGSTSPMRILVGVDGSAGSESALRWALREAAARDAVVTALLAWTPGGIPRNVYRQAVAADHDGLTRAGIEIVEATVSRVGRPDPPDRLETVIVQGHPVDVLAEHAAGARADLIVVGRRGAGAARRRLIGSVSQRLVEHSPVPVVVARDSSVPLDDRRPVVVGVDGSAFSLAALRWAAGAAAAHHAPLRVVHAWAGLDPLYSDMLLSGDAVGHLAQKILDDTVKLGLDEAPDVDVTTVVASRPPALALLSESEDAQLLVVGSRGHGGFPTLALGSVSHQCVQHAACSVAVVRADQLPSTG